MKKYFLALIIALCSVCGYSQEFMIESEIINTSVGYHLTKSVREKTLEDNGEWTKWSQPKKCSYRVFISYFSDLVISVDSPDREIYYIYDWDREYVDSDGDRVINMYAEDREGYECEVRLIQFKEGELKMYIEFADIMWVYTL
ncbi:MAG: hypothetical protein KBT20_01085 [Bacteroidales bacterium]|nr:hypothetical protein [Candidatus Liminaster caballi]